MAEAVAAAGDPGRAPTLSPLELACGVALGAQPGVVLPPPAPAGSARHALEESVATHLQRAPCVVSFSGGRDSSAIVAVALPVAPPPGLAFPPVPVTLRFPGVPLTDESDWQELIITHLGLPEWQRIDLTDQLDLLGPTARHALARHGLGWPPNVHLHLPIFQAARGGSVLTGLDGDGLFGDWRWCHAQAVLHRIVAAHWQDAARIGLAFSPRSLRRRVLARQPSFVPDWLRPAAQDEMREALLSRAAGEPRRWDRRVPWHAGSRALYLAQANLDVLGADLDVVVAHPLLAPGFLAALAAEGGADGFGDRTSARLAPGRRPVARHAHRAAFQGGVRGRRGGAPRRWPSPRRWGWAAGLDADRVDAQRVQAAWLSEHPVFHSWTVLQQAYLSGARATGQAK